MDRHPPARVGNMSAEEARAKGHSRKELMRAVADHVRHRADTGSLLTHLSLLVPLDDGANLSGGGR